ncbi:hypothetical protein [Halovivax cerinus]|uniref:Exonuclease RecJ n=1 Tax=Halovivax cerinus TaxID=1487865 RepID=A0ABD5NK11_9EURY|nr:hypothetical protein [Halovivax cerinus]
MTTTGRSTEATPATLDSAGFVQLLARPDGDALAAAGVLARALATRGTPYQVSLGERTERADRVATDADAVTVAFGPLHDGDTDQSDGPRTDDVPSDAVVEILDPTTGSLTGRAVALVDELAAEDELDVDPDPALALAGTIAAGYGEPDTELVADVVEIARETGTVDRRPGVAIPTDDVVDGLAHSTLVRADWSGDADAVADAIGDAEGRRVASLVAIDAIGRDGATDRATETLDRIVHPDVTPAAPLETVGGLADVLAATARTSPAAAIALAIGHGGPEAALDAWRAHGEAVHAAIDAAETARHDGVFVLRLGEDAPETARTDAIESVAELVAATSTPESLVCVVGDDRVGLAATDGPVEPAADAIAAAHDLSWDAGHRAATIRLDDEPTDDGDTTGTTIDADAVIESARGRV